MFNNSIMIKYRLRCFFFIFPILYLSIDTSLLFHLTIFLMLKYFFSLVNIALNKPANLQHPLIPDDNTHNASNAVDGRKSNLTWDGGQCSASAARETATWWVNLTGIRSIHHITIYYMVGQRPWGISTNYQITILLYSLAFIIACILL